MDSLILYIDGNLIFSKTLEKHQKILKIFPKEVYDNGIVLFAKKMKLFHDTVEFLRHKIEKGQMKIQEHTMEFTEKFLDVIKDKTQLQRFLGCLKYLSPYYKNLAADKKC